MHIENATATDAPDLARLVNLAGEVIPMYLWSGMASGDEAEQMARDNK